MKGCFLNHRREVRVLRAVDSGHTDVALHNGTPRKYICRTGTVGGLHFFVTHGHTNQNSNPGKRAGEGVQSSCCWEEVVCLIDTAGA